MMFYGLLGNALKGLSRNKKRIVYTILGLGGLMALTLTAGKVYQHLDQDEDRGAIPLPDSALGKGHSVPGYLEQGWDRADSLWFYTTTQGSNLLPYDFFLVLEQAGSQELFRSDDNVDYYRYLPQKSTFFNPDALPVGFAKDNYQGKYYLGYTCAACHTGQINFKGKALRIDGGPGMADMVGFLTAMQAAMEETLKDDEKFSRFADAVLELNNDFDSSDEVREELARWTRITQQYNLVNYSSVDYGYARLDAFGRIYNRVLQHLINKEQARDLMLLTTDGDGKRLLTRAEVDLVLDGINEVIIGNKQFALVVERLMSSEPGYPGLGLPELKLIRDKLFNEPNAPVSYPFLWDIAQSDYVQWNGIANNAGPGPLGRNAGEVVGVFATLDWSEDDSWWNRFSIPAHVSKQNVKSKQINFKSSVDLTNLERLESQLKSLKSPVWPEDVLGAIDDDAASRGQLLYAEYCQSCHEVIDRNDWNRIVVANMMAVDKIQTDPAMAENSVSYTGKSGNFEHTYQTTTVGDVIVGEEAPAAMLLAAAVSGTVATPDADKWWLRRVLDWIYVMAMSFFDNDIKASIKTGDYMPATTSGPFNDLLAYKARSLNGIWATAPYLHNGSVPTLYDLLLPAECTDEVTECRPASFEVGSREFNPEKVGFETSGFKGTTFSVFDAEGNVIRGNSNRGHEYAAGKTPQLNGEVLPALTEPERKDLLEYLKTL